MNTPNKLTLLRILMIPFFVIFLLWESVPHRFLWALIVFVLASMTDWLDGHLARKHGLITDFGKFLDPLADKMLVLGALICFVQLGLSSAVAVLIIVAREFLVTSLRLVAAGSGTVIAASFWGKAKTVSQMTATVLIMLLQEFASLGMLAPDVARLIGECGLWIAVLFTVGSGVQYLYVNRGHIDPSH